MKEMIAGLKATQEMLSSWSASAAAAKDLQRLIDLMSRDEDLSVAQFCAKAERALEERDNGKPPKSGTKEPNKELADRYLEQIQSAQLTRSALREIVDRLNKDKKCRLQELDYIANTLTQSGRSYRSKKDAIQDIDRYGHRRLDVERRMEDTSSVF